MPHDGALHDEILPGNNDNDPARVHSVGSWLPPGELGSCRVNRFTVSPRESNVSVLRALLNPNRNARILPVGEYTQLWEGDTMWMSDTPGEIEDHRVLFLNAKGNVLLHGLGLGMAAKRVLQTPDVRHVTIVERNQDILEYVTPHLLRAIGLTKWETMRRDGRPIRYEADRVVVKIGDAFKWKPSPNDRWEVIWHDIWSSLSTDNTPEMRRLGLRFSKYAGLQLYWGHAELCRLREQARRRARHAAR